MKCVEVEKQLDFLTNDEITLSEQNAIERHLQNCPACRAKFESLEFVDTILKQSVFPSKNLDVKILAAFEKHHAAQNITSPIREKSVFWKRIFVPVPVFALILALFAAAIGTAYWLGKNSGEKIAVADQKDSETSNQSTQTLVKYVQIPTIKIVEVPVVKERKVARIIYREKRSAKNFAPENLENPEVKDGANKQVITEFNLKGFQTVSELKPEIIKEGKNQ